MSSAPPLGKAWPHAILDHCRQLKAAEVLSFIRMYALPSLRGLPAAVFNVWRLFCLLSSGLLVETAVPKNWVTMKVAVTIQEFVEAFQV